MRLAIAVAGLCVLLTSSGIDAQNGASAPRAELRSAPRLALPGGVDSNSPAVWEQAEGRNVLFVMTSFAGQPSLSWGFGSSALTQPRRIALDSFPEGGIWMEAVIRDVGGTWYGFYHNETAANMCGRSDMAIPKIGAARSVDYGVTWEALGTVLEAPPRTYDCTTNNAYFVGGVGDFTVMLDRESQDLYFFYSLYLRDPSQQGVGVARMAWADRDEPTGKVSIWRQGTWLSAVDLGRGERARWIYPPATPIFPAAESWHDDNSVVDAFWGPSVHWNTFLSRYVMLLNHANDVRYRQEGIYIAFAASLDDPRAWSAPVKILNGGRWYPQVLGLESGTGTDKSAGESARFYMSGESEYLIRFVR